MGGKGGRGGAHRLLLWIGGGRIELEVAGEVGGVGAALREEDGVRRVQVLRTRPELAGGRRGIQRGLSASISGRARTLHVSTLSLLRVSTLRRGPVPGVWLENGGGSWLGACLVEVDTVQFTARCSWCVA